MADQRGVSPARRIGVARALACLALGLAPATGVAQGSPVGDWVTEYYRTTGGHGSDGEAQLIRARLTIAQRGDSLVGQWQDLVASGAPVPRPRGLRGVVRNGAVILLADSVRATIRRHLGAEQVIQLVSTYELAVRGDSLVGTQRMRSTDGALDNPPRRFTAVRVRP